jgi:feruloyl esterase
MKTATLIVALLAPLAVSAWKAECDAFKLPAGYGANVTLIGTDWYDAGANVTLPAGSSPAFVTGLPAFCRVNIIINTNATAGTRARSEIWLPDSCACRGVCLSA